MSQLLVAQRALTVPGWAKDALWRKARAVPSLDLRFADSKSLVDATTGSNLVTFTRASSGTFVGSDGQIKTATTNLLLRSEEFNDASIWTTAGSITRNANADTAPNGTLTADQLIFAAADTTVLQAVTIASGISYAVSIWIKGTAGETIRFTANGIPGGSSVTLTGGWTRYSFVGTSNSTSGSLNISTFAGATARSIYLWGAQLEQSSTVGEYIPTTSTINSAPRFDHNPTTGESLGLLVEEQRTNLALQSEDFSTTWAVSQTTVTVNSIASPTGATTADAIFETSATSEHRIRQNFTGLTANTNYTISVYVKDLGGRNLNIRVLDTDNVTNGYLATFSPLSGTVVTAATSLGSGVAASASITALLGGWYRVALTGNAGATCTKYILDFFSFSGTSNSFAGDTGKGLYLWGAQLE